MCRGRYRSRVRSCRCPGVERAEPPPPLPPERALPPLVLPPPHNGAGRPAAGGSAGAAAAPSPSAGSSPAAATRLTTCSARSRPAGQPNAARALAAGGPRSCSALFPARLHFPAGAGRLPSDPHLRARRLPLVHLLHYKGNEGRPRPPRRPPFSGPAAPLAAASPAATARLRAGNCVPPPLPRLSELLGSF
ncbi:transcription initiation factor TFIID subunit 4-like [Hylobates moloch]|uniref:transcription initiation factor TFIID subunit 4-like n=1 Tax=Hylobates moloch TaxID=81572 RepID=UPI001363159F|nr:transcription initiation factor TFIID subunit 4-like [Hylobates moloch]XP_055147521.1 transcription initiation factor TFIID subunit 4-like [Symphalangus syndactylus]